MKNFKNKMNAVKNKAVGAAKESTGSLTGNAKLEKEGSRERRKGQIQGAVENIKDIARPAAKKSA